MKKNALIAIFWLCSSACFCQSQSTEFGPGTQQIEFKGSYESWSTHFNANETKTNGLITFADRDKVYYYLVDSLFKIIGEYSVSKDAMTANYYGSKYEMVLQTSTNNSFRNYIHKQKGDEIFVENIDFDHSNSSTSDFIQFGKKEKFLTAFEENGHLYFLTLIRKTHKLKVYVDSSSVAKEIELRIEDSILHVNLDENLQDIVIIKNNKEADLYSCMKPTKLYIQGDGQIIITLDSNVQYTTLFKIDLNNFTSESRFIRKSFYYCNNNEDASAVKSNSFVYRDKILQGVFCRNELLLQLKYILSDSLIEEFHASRDSAITFASSALIKRKEGKSDIIGILGWNLKKTIREQTEKDLKTKDFFKAVNGSNFTFVIVPKNEYLVIKVGEAHDLMQTRFGASNTFMTRTIVNAPSGPVSVPTWTDSGPTYRSSKIGETETYFKTVLDKSSLEFLPSNDLQTKYDKIDLAKDDIKDIMAAESVFDFNQKTFLFYLDKKQKKFFIERIE
ncbi:MAG: hypothetical protein JST75_06130 [Bacteroidetes bacterium]|nr:hypothetical protein [Bacteroidota bacterium]